MAVLPHLKKKADGTAMLTLKLTLRDVITHVPCTLRFWGFCA